MWRIVVSHRLIVARVSLSRKSENGDHRSLDCPVVRQGNPSWYKDRTQLVARWAEDWPVPEHTFRTKLSMLATQIPHRQRGCQHFSPGSPSGNKYDDREFFPISRALATGSKKMAATSRLRLANYNHWSIGIDSRMYNSEEMNNIFVLK